MFDNLLETKKKKERTLGGTIISVVIHAVAIGAAVYGTLNAREAILEKPKAEKVDFVEVKKEEPKQEPEKAPPPPEVTVAPPPPKGFTVLAAPVHIPDVIPDIDLSKKVTDEADFSGKGVQGGSSKGVVGGSGPVNDNQAFFEFQVDKPAQQMQNGWQPRYTESLRDAQISGEVQAEFVVDTTGRAEMRTFKVLKATNDQFASAVKAALPSARYLPAEAGG